MTLSSVMFYTGENPYIHEKVYVARSQEEKRRQKAYFFDERPAGKADIPGKKNGSKKESRPKGRQSQTDSAKSGQTMRPTPGMRCKNR